MKLGHTIDQSCRCAKRLPGLGPRSAQRHRFPCCSMIATGLCAGRIAASRCTTMGMSAVQHADGSRFAPRARARIECALLCVVESPADQLVIEQSLAYGGLYSVMMGRYRHSMESARAKFRWSLLARVADGIVREVIVATSFTPEGDATAHYITQLVRERDPQLKVTRLARGVPAGAELEYTDVNTVAQAMLDRRAD